VGHLLLALGLLVGAAAGIGLLIGFEPARLPPALLNVAAYKLTFLAALGLFAGGAVCLRYARRRETYAPPPGLPGQETKDLTEGQPAQPAPGEGGKPVRTHGTRS
jgi:hypothetical protein